MIFILLIFFVVSTTFSKLPGIEIQKPSATTPDQLPPQHLIIGVSAKGEYVIKEKTYTPPELEDKLNARFKQQPQLQVMLMADKESALKHTITALDLCKKIGIQKVAVAEEILP